MRRWYHWIISPRRSLLLWLAEREAARQRELAEQERRLDEAVREAEQASAEAERYTLQLELERLTGVAGTAVRHSFGADRYDNPLLLMAALGSGRVEAQAFTAYGSIAHLEMTLEAAICLEAAELVDMRGLNHSRGVGTALLQFTEPIVREMGARLVYGSVRVEGEEHLARLTRFFMKNGYRILIDGDTLSVEKALDAP